MRAIALHYNDRTLTPLSPIKQYSHLGFAMEGVTDKLMNYQQIVQQLLMGYAESKPAYGEIEVETIFDTQRNHYQIVHLGWQHKRWVHHCIMHLDIRNEKIWIFYNSTEHDIAAD